MVFRIPKQKLLLVIIMFFFLMENCFYLIDSSVLSTAGLFSYSDIWLVLFFLYFAWQHIKYRNFKVDYKYGGLVIFLCFMIFITAIQQNYLTGQSIGLGIRPQRNYLIILLSYFPIRKIFKIKKINNEKLLDILLLVGIFSSILYLIQGFLYKQIQFIHVLTTYSGAFPRMYIDSSLIGLTALISTYRFSKSYKIRYLICLGICVLYELIVSQGRMEFMSILIAVTVGIFLSGKLSTRKMIVLFVMSLMIFIFLTSNYGVQLLNAIRTASVATTQQGNTMAIRYEGRALYFSQLSENVRTLLLGCGYPNQLYVPASLKAGFYSMINLNDNGIFGYIYIYGIFGFILIIIMAIKMIRMSWRLYKESGNTVPIMYMCMIIVMSYNIIFWYWHADGTFLLVIMISLLEHQLYDADY